MDAIRKIMCGMVTPEASEQPQTVEATEATEATGSEETVEATESEETVEATKQSLTAEERQEKLKELEARLFRKENFTLPKGREKKLKEKGFKEKEHYYIKKGKFYCGSKDLMVFILGGEENAKQRTIDRYNWAVLSSGDTESPRLKPNCTNEELVKAFRNAKARRQWIQDPSVKQKLDNVNHPVGLVGSSDGRLDSTSRSVVPLWAPEHGQMFLIRSDAGEWDLG